jgi:hypothetical protein
MIADGAACFLRVYNPLMPRRKRAFGGLSMSDAELMAAALFGLEHQRSDIEGKMADIRRAIRSTDLTKSAAMPTRRKRTMSAAARRRIAAAQRKRWAAVKNKM